MTKLSVNINKLATLRNSRGGNLPDVAVAAARILNWGAHGITVHPRPDGRHIRTADVTAVNAVVRERNVTDKAKKEFNVEGYPSTAYLAILADVRPDQATLVPDPPEALTSSAGWRLAQNEQLLRGVVAEIKTHGIRVSIFIEPETMTEDDFLALARIGTDRVELYTEAFAKTANTGQEREILKIYQATAERIRDLRIGINAGHDLNQNNLSSLITWIPWIDEVSIGHALISEALYDGLEKTVKNYLRVLGWQK